LHSEVAVPSRCDSLWPREGSTITLTNIYRAIAAAVTKPSVTACEGKIFRTCLALIKCSRNRRPYSENEQRENPHAFVHERACVLLPHARIRESFEEGTLPLGRSVAAANLKAAAERCAPIAGLKVPAVAIGRQDKEFSCAVSAASGLSKKFNERDAIAGCSGQKIL
jgi:hypothetical protein